MKMGGKYGSQRLTSTSNRSSLWTWAKTLCRLLRHTEGWRLSWAAALLLLLLGAEWTRHLQPDEGDLTLTLLLKPGLEEGAALALLHALPARPAVSLRSPAQLLEEAQLLLNKLPLAWPEEGPSEGEAFPEEAIGFEATLHWRGLSLQQTQQLRMHIAQAAWAEAAFWATPAVREAPAGLHRAACLLFSASGLAALLVLSFACLRAEAERLQLLLELGATPGQVRRLWLAQGLAWATASSLGANALWKLAQHSFGLPGMPVAWGLWVAWGMPPWQGLEAEACCFLAPGWVLGGGALLVAWLFRGRACCR